MTMRAHGVGRTLWRVLRKKLFSRLEEARQIANRLPLTNELPPCHEDDPVPWIDVEPPATRPKKRLPSSAAVSVSLYGKPNARRMAIIVRPAMIADDPPAWWKPGVRVNVARGTVDQAGQLRIERNDVGKFVLTQTAKKLGVLVVEPLAGADPTGTHEQTAVTYDYNENWIVVDLPAWAWKAPVPLRQPKPVALSDRLEAASR